MRITFKFHLSDNFSVKGIVSPSQNRKSVENTVKKKQTEQLKILLSIMTQTSWTSLLQANLIACMTEKERIVHVSKDVAEQNMIEKKEKSRKLKLKVHHGKFENDEFDKDAFYQKLSNTQQKSQFTGTGWLVNTTLLIKASSPRTSVKYWWPFLNTMA